MSDNEIDERRREVAARLADAGTLDGVAVPLRDRWNGLHRPPVRYMIEGEDVAELHRLLEVARVFDRRPPAPPTPAEGEEPQPDTRGAVRAEVGITDDHRDAWFGPYTERAVRAFQGKVRLPQTGACDDATWLALYAEESIQQR